EYTWSGSTTFRDCLNSSIKSHGMSGRSVGRGGLWARGRLRRGSFTVDPPFPNGCPPRPRDRGRWGSRRHGSDHGPPSGGAMVRWGWSQTEVLQGQAPRVTGPPGEGGQEGCVLVRRKLCNSEPLYLLSS